MKWFLMLWDLAVLHLIYLTLHLIAYPVIHNKIPDFSEVRFTVNIFAIQMGV